MSEATFPRSPYDRVDDFVYFARMLDKIRLHARHALPEAYHANLGGGFDHRCCHVLGVSYEALKARVLAGEADEAVMAWARAEGRNPDEEDRLTWNAFMAKRGWRDEASERLEHLKQAAGLGDRTDIATFFDFLDADEGRARR